MSTEKERIRNENDLLIDNAKSAIKALIQQYYHHKRQAIHYRKLLDDDDDDSCVEVSPIVVPKTKPITLSEAVIQVLSSKKMGLPKDKLAKAILEETNYQKIQPTFEAFVRFLNKTAIKPLMASGKLVLRYGNLVISP